MVADPELKYTPSGKAVCSFRIAVDKRFKSETGEKQADFINIVAWERSAEFVANYLTKGRLVGIQGRLSTRSWVQQDGQKRFTMEVVAENVQGLDKPKDTQAAPETVGTVAAPAGAGAAGYGPGETESDMDYDPFAEE